MRTGPRSRAGQLALIAVAIAVMGYLCERLIALLADVRPYTGWYWLLAVASGIVVAVVVPWALVAVFRRHAPWWVLVCLFLVYFMALIVGTQYYLGLRFTPPVTVPAVLPAPPPRFVLEMAGLSSVAFTFVALTLVLLAAAVPAVAPGPFDRWARARRRRRPPSPLRPTRRPRLVDERTPTRLRLEGPDGRPGPWLRGAIRARPGSLLWEPARGVLAAPAELTSATIVPGGRGWAAVTGEVVTVDMPNGRIQLDCGDTMFALLQRLATEAVNGRLPPVSPGHRRPGPRDRHLLQGQLFTSQAR